MTIKEFFVDEIVSVPFKLFGKTHLILIALVVLFCLFIYFNRTKIYQLKPKTKKRITKSFAVIFLLNMLILYISSIYYQNFNYKTMLPLHLCYIANYFYIFTTLFNKENLYKYIYFLSFLGPIPAIIFFDVPSVLESFNFYLYVISHHILLIASFLTFYMYPKKITLKDAFKLILTLNIIYILITIFNHSFNTNYFFSEGIPPFIIDLLPFLKSIPNSIILEFLGILTISILYIFYNKERVKILK